MFTTLILFLVFPRLIYQLLCIFLLISLIICYGIHKTCKSSQNQSTVRNKSKMQDKIMMRFKNLNFEGPNLCYGSDHRRAHVTLAILFIICSLASSTLCDEQDAKILKPVHSLSKGIIAMVADGKQLNLDFSTGDLIRSGGLLVWRARFPMRMPAGVVQKSQDLLNRVSTKVNQTDISGLGRKTMSRLGEDLNQVVDSLLEEVRKSPDGIYTDYLQTSVNGLPLEEALYQIGLQLKAYQTDLIHYRDLAAMLLGIPVMPSVASTINNAISQAPNFQTLKDITQSLVQNSNLTVHQAANIARNVVNQGASISSNIPGVSTMTNIISTPISTITGGRLALS